MPIRRLFWRYPKIYLPMNNPIRRNKNIGKTQGGRVKFGRAEEKWSRLWFNTDIYARISDSEGIWQIFKENPSIKYFHPCEGKEYIKILQELLENLTKYVKAIILPRISKNDAKNGIDAKRRSECIIINPFPKSMEFTWFGKPEKKVIRHYKHWCNNWENKDNTWKLKWKIKEVKRYYLYHLFLHELGHINQPCYNSLSKKEEYAENFALEWASMLKII